MAVFDVRGALQLWSGWKGVFVFAEGGGGGGGRGAPAPTFGIDYETDPERGVGDE